MKKNMAYKRKWGKIKDNYFKEIITLLFTYKKDSKIRHDKSKS